METMVAHPGDGVARKTYGGAGGEKKLQPLRHLEASVGEIAMEIQGRPETNPEIDPNHDREIDHPEMSPERSHTKQLNRDQDDENGDIKLLVFKHR
jgi:hypothetical protein